MAESPVSRRPRFRHQDLAAALAFLAASVVGTHYFLRSRDLYGPTWSDGEQRYHSRAGEAVRHAVWGPPEILLANEEARDPVLSPDGRVLVFVVGERGLNAELFASEIEEGHVGAPERLGLCTAADELAPAFAPGWLYFASDRPGGNGGLDVWRAPYYSGDSGGSGVFGAAEPIPPGVNSPADETDPAPAGVLEEGVLYLASNRPRGMREDYALYRARPDAGHLELERLEELDSPFDEREPSLAPDGRALLFASDRSGGSGGFDLWRSLRPEFDPERPWSTAAPLQDLNGSRDERGPWTSPEGFALLFEGRDEAGDPLLLRARSRELLLLPAPPVSLAEWLLFLGLLLVSLLALLAKRWRPLDILYKCVLVSLLLHLLLMLYLRTVTPQSETRPFGREDGPTMRVRLAPAETGVAHDGGARRALDSQPEAPERQRFEANAPPAIQAALEPLSTLVAAPETWPERAPAAVGEPTLERASPTLAMREEALERYAASAPALALPAPIGENGRQKNEDREPERHVASAPPTQAPEPALAVERVLPEGALDDPRAAGPPRAALQASARTATSVALATPSDGLVPASGAPRSLELPDLRPGASVPCGLPETTPERAASKAEALLAGPTVPTAGAIALPAAEHVPAPRSAERITAVAAPAAAPALRSAGEELGSPAPDSQPIFDALAASAPSRATPRPQVRGRAAPQRVQSTAQDHSALLPESAAPRTVALAALIPTLADPVLATERARAPLPVSRTPELREPSEEPARDIPVPAAHQAFDALEGLVTEREPPRTPAPPTPKGPARAALADARPVVPALEPVRSAWAAPAPEPARAPVPDRDATRLERSAYQNRFGDQKLRALEEFGGTQETEHAVAQGLLYLAAIQESKGAWGERRDAHDKYQDVRIGKTGLALLAFLGAGHLPGQANLHASTVDRAVQFLLEAQRPNGHFGNCGPYGHGIATYALAEAFALTRDERLRGPVESGVARIVAAQLRDGKRQNRGGWGYFFADEHVWNNDSWPRTSVTAWQVMALESARLSGLSVPDETFSAAREFLLGTWDSGAQAFRYDHDPSRLSSGYPILPASTPAALFALSLLGLDAAGPELEAARRFVLVRKPDGYRYTGDDDFVRRARGNLYFWYYGTLAMFRVGGPAWEGWNGAMKQTLLPAQRQDGSWAPLDIYGEYAGDEDDESAYTTALCVLTLEIYYRYFTPLLR